LTKSRARYLCSNDYRKFLKKPEDFVVREVIDSKFLQKYQRADKGVEKVGKYTLFLLKKRNMTTREAINRIAKMQKVPVNEFSYAGLKDRFALTYQYVTVRGEIKPLKTDNLEISGIRKTGKRISVGDLVANEFIITLHNCRNIKKVKKMPNFFGPQRFGRNMNNHLIGRCIVKRKWEKALGLINKNSKNSYKEIRKVSKKMLKFFVNAYQSWLFNRMLETAKKRTLPIIGYDTKPGKEVKEILGKERIELKDFVVSELGIACKGSKRKAFVSVSVDIKKEADKTILRFRLPKGSYATILLGWMCKT